MIQYVKSKNYLELGGPGLFRKLVVACVYGAEQTLPDRAEEKEPLAPPPPAPPLSAGHRAVRLLLCVAGLQVSYLTWGVLQEKIMTKDYSDGAEGSEGHFGNSQFLVFVNRILAFVMAGAYLLSTRQPRHTAPLYTYSYCAFSNVMSSWFQYEALKFVSFPTQVLAKASKIIPVMAMGRLVSGKRYEYYEYFTALLISAGMALFLLGSAEQRATDHATTLSGVLLLAGYMGFDAFTSNWQGSLFSQHGMSSVQMMAGVNMWSCLLTSVSLLQQGGFGPCLSFMLRYPVFMWDCVVLSVCSATGQLFIYYTISVFGPVVFIIIMTVRQALAILLSCLLYSHPVTATGALGVSVVFGAVLLRVYCSHRVRLLKRAPADVRNA